MARHKRKSRTPKQWYDEEHRPKNWRDYAYRVEYWKAFALFLIGSPFLAAYDAADGLAWPTWNDVFVSLPFIAIGLAILGWYASPAFRRRRAGWGHDSKIDRLQDGSGYRAICDCGWEGPVRASREGAIDDHGGHLLPTLDPRRAIWRK